MADAAVRADGRGAVITMSEFSRREIDRAARGRRPGRSTSFRQGSGVAHLDCPGPGDPEPGPGPESRVPSPYSVLYVGSIFNRRHVTDLIRAFAPIARERAATPRSTSSATTAAIRAKTSSAAIADEGLQTTGPLARVRHPREQLRDLYARARAFAFLSEYEGLGMTPLEALAAGVPPVLLDTAVARESCATRRCSCRRTISGR